MATFYFHFHDGGDVVLDEEGYEVRRGDLADHALREVRGMIAADVLVGRIDLAQRIEVQDADGLLVHRLRFADAIEIAGWP